MIAHTSCAAIVASIAAAQLRVDPLVELGAPDAYERTTKAADFAGIAGGVGQAVKPVLDATDPLNRMKRQGDLLEQEVRLKKLQKEKQALEAAP